MGRESMEIDRQKVRLVPDDLAKRLGSQGVRKLLTLLAKAYQDLYDRQYVKADSSEDSITEEWFVDIQKRWRSDGAFGLVPIHQKQDTGKARPRGRPPTIDFCFRDTFFPESYLGAECKLLDEKSGRHLTAYLDDSEGIGRFINGKYAAHTSVGAMVGYVRRGDCCVVADDVGLAMRRLDGSPVLNKSRPLPQFDHLYESEHVRCAGISPFLCYHLLFAFNC
jgi:hypothetical protein